MKSKSFILVLIAVLVIAASVSFVFAENASVSGHTFTIPDGYTINETESDTVALTLDDNHTIVVVVSDEIDENREIVNLESEGYSFTVKGLYDYGDFNVVQQNYNSTEYAVYNYLCSSDPINLIIRLTMPSGEPPLEGADNPVCEILDTID